MNPGERRKSPPEQVSPPAQKFHDALEWILGSAKDERRVDRGEKPEKFSEEIVQRAVPRTRARIGGLHTQLHVLALDRAASIRRMDEMAAKLEASEADRKARLEAFLSLQCQITELATTKVSLKRVAAAVARRLGIFHFLKRRQQRLERVYDLLYRIVSRAQEGPPEK